MNIKNSILDYIRYKQLNWYGHVQRKDEEGYLKNFGSGAHMEEEEKEELNFREFRK